MLDQLSILLTHLLCHTKNTFILANVRLHKVTTDKFQEAFELLNDCISTFCTLECGTGTIPSCLTLQAKEAKATKSKLDKVPKRPAATDLSELGFHTPGTKRQCSGMTGNATPTNTTSPEPSSTWVQT